MTDTKPDFVATIYDLVSKIKAGEAKAEEHEAEYTKLVEMTKDDDIKNKLLSAGFIPELFSHYPSQAETAIYNLMELLSDDDTSVRRKTVPGLVSICKGTPEHIPRITDVFGQLLPITEDNVELAIIKKAFNDLYQIDTKAVFDGLLTQIKESKDTEPLQREKSLEFIVTQIREHKKQIIKVDGLLPSLTTGIKSLLSVSFISLPSLRPLLSEMFKFHSVRKDKDLSAEFGEIIMGRAGYDGEFDGSEEGIKNLTAITQMSFKYIANGADATEMYSFFFEKAVPALSTLEDKHKLAVFKLIAGASKHVSAPLAKKYFPVVASLILENVPEGSSPTTSKSTSSSGEGESESKEEEPAKLNWSVIECLFYVVHNFARVHHNGLKDHFGIFVATGQPSDFSSRIQEAKALFTGRFKRILDSIKPYRAQVEAVQKKISQKVRETKDADEKKDLLGKKASVRSAINTVENIHNTVAPLLSRNGPRILDANEIALSWLGNGVVKRPEKKRPAEKKASGSGKGTKKVKQENGKGGKGGKGGKKKSDNESGNHKKQKQNNGGAQKKKGGNVEKEDSQSGGRKRKRRNNKN